LECINKGFSANRLSLSFDKTHFIQFTTKTILQIDFDTSYADNPITKAYDTKFLGIYVDSTLSWKIRIEQITHECQERMKAVYCAGLHSL
jgi:hypothetical protein